MEEIRREEIRLIAKFSNWSSTAVSQVLNKSIYNDSNSWIRFLKLFLLGTGVAFTVAGIIFFFAYNWDSMHKFFKLGLVGSLILVTVLAGSFIKMNPVLNKVLLTAGALLVGVFLAVFGQIYQTGANAYDLFLNWTLFIVIWVAIVNFAALWTVFITLVNITIILYSEQVAHDWSVVFLFTLLFWVNSLFFLLFILGSKWIPALKMPQWFNYLLALAAITYATMGVCAGLYDPPEAAFYLLLLTGAILYTASVWHGLLRQKPFYLSIVGFSGIIMVTALLIKISESAGMFFFISLFIIASVTALILLLVKLHKRWSRRLD